MAAVFGVRCSVFAKDRFKKSVSSVHPWTSVILTLAACETIWPDKVMLSILHSTFYKPGPGHSFHDFMI